MRPLSSVSKTEFTSPEDVVLSSTCGKSLCSSIKISDWEITVLYPNDAHWKLTSKEMNQYTDGRSSNTLVISSQLLILLPKDSNLLACVIIRESLLRRSKFCESYSVKMPEKCDSCELNAPEEIDDFQTACVTCSCTYYDGDRFEFYSRQILAHLTHLTGIYFSCDEFGSTINCFWWRTKLLYSNTGFRCCCNTVYKKSPRFTLLY